MLCQQKYKRMAQIFFRKVPMRGLPLDDLQRFPNIFHLRTKSLECICATPTYCLYLKVFAGRGLRDTATNSIANGESTGDWTQPGEKDPRLQLLLLLVRFPTKNQCRGRPLPFHQQLPKKVKRQDGKSSRAHDEVTFHDKWCQRIFGASNRHS